MKPNYKQIYAMKAVFMYSTARTKQEYEERIAGRQSNYVKDVLHTLQNTTISH